MIKIKKRDLIHFGIAFFIALIISERLGIYLFTIGNPESQDYLSFVGLLTIVNYTVPLLVLGFKSFVGEDNA